MEQSRPRHKEQNFLIVVNRSWFYVLIDFIFSLFFWLYSLVVVSFILSATFGFNNTLTKVLNASFNMTNQDIRTMFIAAIVVFLLFYVLLYINHVYNKKRFGTLKRRSYPAPVSNTELKTLGLMDIETIEKLQSEDYTVFDTNPIVPLGGEKR
ncbi:poly-beta-1,6-N-acetyl-D-glucosamine biosynthesis protein PgaD [Planococcus sp. ISL-109]|uniref:poly-beta-1,6-N-acetyl-D-glucosamine biosynthesis protein PgaD n=1 Tax=Planococcus sp. ISL-109 TaxID=2819166 RepID=UPI001BE9B2DE|nr:poly-beta-1,6-N-acetyl-D-glucosamine biosynthesis protein PgaD [Planococcus sp. ISL-109]MBT2583862.1 poly-beta-1,6-N-acetyl-D-glucosamine biosynthesis protein PgaD [Planococcus sp. ISL-109]